MTDYGLKDQFLISGKARMCFRRVSKISKSDYYLRHVCPSVRLGQLGSQWTDFHEVRYLSNFQKSFTKNQVSLKSNKNNGQLT